ncbi:MBL fold metallo-hydrolase [Mucilaginibacter gossypii]|uniref:L-ascorbate metabolism protein UlaG, beta-lactamase superfamily n=2 Tax=Mucilaginibacter TaxID=423349 RepID=A0A1G8N9F2_9SPHI|nr:MBL fold metallo-hydrolase [Mucilaginibacter gossypii]SDI76911.1 L-ascorbate metabolism protein UlaG, beta-lactamase superfamily [Mucilaginibacter gossypii]
MTENLNESQLTAIYIGGPTLVLEIGGLRIITDPTLDPEGTSFKIDNKLTISKLSGPATNDVGVIDLVLLSHDQHSDNLDHAGRELMFKVGHTITTPAAAQRLKNGALGLSPWENVEIDLPDGRQMTATTTPARHGPSGTDEMQGDVTGFVLQVNGSKEFSLYITGDTVFYEGVLEVAKRFDPDYVFIFAGAAKPKGPFNVTMDTNDAIDTAFCFPRARIIPLHHEGWSHYTEGAEVLATAFSVLDIGSRLMILEKGQPTRLKFS